MGFLRHLGSNQVLVAQALTAASVLAIAACGASSNSAPVVYGTEPATGRIYNSPADVYLERPAPTAVAASTLNRQGPTLVAQNSPVVTYGEPQYLSSPSQAGAPATQATGRVYVRDQQGGAYPTQSYTISQPVDSNRGVPIYNSPPPAATTTARQPVIRTEIGNLPASQTQQYRGLPPAPTYLSEPGLSRPSQPAVTTVSAPVQNAITVQRGDTVYAISRRTGYAPGDIIAINGLVPPYRLNVGQVLRLPTNAVDRAPYTDPYRAPVTTPVQRNVSYGAAPAYTAPVSTPAPSRISGQVIARDLLYPVAQGDTLYSIARTHAITVDSIISANRLTAPYNLSIGRQLLLPAVPLDRDAARANLARTAPRQAVVRAPAPRRAANVNTRTPQNIETLTREASYSKPLSTQPERMFDWPIKGSVLSTFGSGGIGRRNDGINIAAPQGTTIRAAAAGEVVYRGTGPDGFGNLLLIKHDGGYVTAYAHNDVMLVRKGQKVKRGQIIAKVGKTGAVSEPQLHFEIRQNLKSVDPMQYLAAN